MAKSLLEVKSTKTKLLSVLGVESTDKKVFINDSTLRLTKFGCSLLRKEYDFWELESPGLLSKYLIILQNKMQYPYYIDKKILVLFSEQDAFMARLAGADGWLMSK